MSELIDRGARVLDVSADHRLRDAALYPPVYGFDHPRPDLLAEAVYGLPERYRDAHRRRPGWSPTPGCFPEASILALLPLAGALADVVIDAKSGVSGAGRTPTETVHYSSAADNVSPYKVYAHRHTPEIEQELGVRGDVHAAPGAGRPGPAGHLLRPPDRARRAAPGRPARALLAATTPTHPFVEVVERPPGMRAVQHTNYAQVCPVADPRGGRVTVVRRHRQPRQGRGRAGRAEPEPHGRAARDGGPPLNPRRRARRLAPGARGPRRPRPAAR